MIKRQQIIEVVPYDPDWSNQFEKEALLLKLIFLIYLLQSTISAAHLYRALRPNQPLILFLK